MKNKKLENSCGDHKNVKNKNFYDNSTIKNKRKYIYLINFQTALRSLLVMGLVLFLGVSGGGCMNKNVPDEGKINITYPNTNFVWSTGSEVKSEAVATDGAVAVPIAKCTIEPKLPDGITFDENNCNINGKAPNGYYNQEFNIKVLSNTNPAKAGETKFRLRVGYKFFVTSNKTNGSFGGLKGADEFCNSDPKKPKESASVFKAFISNGKTQNDRYAKSGGGEIKQGVNWVILPEKEYFSSEGKYVAKSNKEGLFDFPLKGELEPNDKVGRGSEEYWTGIKKDWTASDDNCKGFTTNGTDSKGEVGRGKSVTDDILTGSNSECSKTYSLLCVETE